VVDQNKVVKELVKWRWALEGFGAAYILQELLTIKSDAMHGREQVIHAILENKPMVIGTQNLKY
jgi:DNA-directed RNA polymerase beta subunit